MKVIVGGTFAYMHKGHKAILRKAFAVGDSVHIGLTSDEYVRKHKDFLIEDYAQRKKELERFVRKLGKKYTVVKLIDKYGPSTKGDYDAIVVSPETYRTAVEINKIRKRHGLKKLAIFKVRKVNAYDGMAISSKRIFARRIDKEGRKVKR
jgi:cytidyltransferase-like protein